MKHKTYDSEFKKQIIEEFRTSALNLSAFSKSKSIPLSTLSKWVLNAQRKSSFIKHASIDNSSLVTVLRAEIADLKKERDALKMLLSISYK